MTSLNKIKAGAYHKIIGFEPNESHRIIRRLCDLGLTPGEVVKVTNKSLLKKAVLVEVKGYILTLKSSIAASILVERA